jgi:hypothetical protein
MRSDGSRGRWVMDGGATATPRPAKRWADSIDEVAAYRNQQPAVAVSLQAPARREVDQFCETLEFYPGGDAPRAPEAAGEAAARSGPQESAAPAPHGSLAELQRLSDEPHGSICLRVEHRRREWFEESRRNVPCWLASMVLHMALVIVLGSLVVPPAARQFVTATLLLSFSEEEPQAASREPTMAAMEVVRNVDRDRATASAKPGDTGSVAPEHPAEELSEPLASVAPFQPADANLTAPAPEPSPQSRAAVQQQPATAQATAARVPPPEPKPASDQSAAPRMNVDLETEKRFDDVVNRFIDYDIGHLRGAEGDRARREFDQLGPEAIPALVRGLNKSAKIYASCPVVVISNKLGQLANRERDPEMLEYVIANVGKGVPKNAPHAARLRALKENLLGELRGSPPKASDTPNLSQQLTSPQADVRIAACEYIAAHAEELDLEDRSSLAWRLIRDLADRRLPVRDAAHRALVALASGKDFGPAEGKLSPAKDVSAAASRWYSHFDQARYEAMAASVLASARHFEDARRRTSAIRYYRKLREEYAGTKAADEAERRLTELTGE